MPNSLKFRNSSPFLNIFVSLKFQRFHRCLAASPQSSQKRKPGQLWNIQFEGAAFWERGTAKTAAGAGPRLGLAGRAAGSRFGRGRALLSAARFPLSAAALFGREPKRFLWVFRFVSWMRLSSTHGKFQKMSGRKEFLVIVLEFWRLIFREFHNFHCEYHKVSRKPGKQTRVQLN